MFCGTLKMLSRLIVDTKKGQELVTKYIMQDEILEGVIPVNYEKIDK